MLKRVLSILAIFTVLFVLGACSNKKVVNPIASLDSKQPDKVLFDRAMQAMKSGKYDVARLTLQTLINAYPDSEYVARAKLAVGDSWYAEGGTAAMQQAENEYKDFITFFPNMPEAAEAQLKIANIHFREMEKPDRDFTHAMRAEEEYRNLITQFPNSKLVPEAKRRLLEVQEVLAEREFRIGRFYYMRESYNAAVARLKSVIDTYPLYSKSDEALYMLGQCYQAEADKYKEAPINKFYTEAAKAKVVKEHEDLAAAAYDKILTRYPVTPRAADAKEELEAMHYPVPTPTPAAIARNKAEMASRADPSRWDRVWAAVHKNPTVTEMQAVKVGEPTLVDPKQTSAVDLIRKENQEMVAAISDGRHSGGDNKISVETNPSGPPPNEAPPRSDDANAQPAQGADPNGIPELTPIKDTSSGSDSAQTAAPPKQVNEINEAGDGADSPATPSSSSTADKNATKKDYSTSKHKKKKGLGKLNPF